MKTSVQNLFPVLALLAILNSPFVVAHAQGTAFSYQGQLNAGGSPANGFYDVRFTVCDAVTNGNVIVGPLTNSATAVSNGLFSVTLDFGAGVFIGPARWLQLDVRTNGGGMFTPLAPREPVMPVPYAIMANSASNLLGTLPATQLPGSVLTNNASNVTLSGTFSGGGSGLTGLNPANLSAGTAGINISGTAAAATTAVNVTGNIADSQLSANIARLNGTNNFTGTNNFLGVTVATNVNNVFKGSFTGNGAGLANLNAAQLTGGTLPLAQLPGAVVTNNAIGVTLNGTFTGNGAGLTNLNATPPSTINENTITIGATNVIAPLTVPPRVPSSAIGSVGTGSEPGSVVVAGRYAYVVNNGANTLQIFDVSSPVAPVSVGSVGTGSEPGSIVVAGRYAYVLADSGLQIFDVSNPTLPVNIGSAATGLYSDPEWVAVAGRFAYVANSGNDTLQIFDVSNPSSPVGVGSVGTGSNPVSVAVAGRYAYVAINPGSGSVGTLQIFDVSNPSSPVSVGLASTGTWPDSVAVSGSYAYVANSYTSTLQIFDVSNPAVPVSVGSVVTGGYPGSAVVAGRYAYVLYISGLQIFDVSNPSLPVSIGTVDTGNQAPTSVSISGRYAYVLNQSGNTLQIFDLGGAYIQQFEAGAMETGTLQTRDTVNVGNNLNVLGGLTVSGSARISGGLNLGGTTTNIAIGGHTFYYTNGILMNIQ